MAACNYIYEMVEVGKMTILERLKNVLMNNYNVAEELFDGNTSFVDDLHLDSLELLEMILTIEDEFDITIPEEKVESITTINELVSVIENAEVAG
ncbi:acyl carrier protein [Pseudobutyrivibrio sp. NOR37]|uniref:Acyl carrier protein n=2 Tax=Pseudobutyrivibrio TaxID=46205 RepID=A0A2G3ECC8_9FIRM|nr:MULTISPECIES: acyl carrier protein [Pseudobutyrivibrio]NEX01823.1 acyl carrier protein [Pseudobutyrivibrio xylanivorans]PHU33753.1 acyl carrier protein [Pseudobutyrivibrio ruminis]PHU40894.1 acyl carrier protein [Pseudobutyrivibrio ruminis]SFR72006.1 acyl carrier protein [Pseudobutyrivibrio sp. NOR37]